MRFAKEKYLYLATSGVLFLYLVLKSLFSPLVFDEATTFLIYINRNEVLPWQGFWSANNHFLNTALSWLCVQALGLSEFALRLPNLLFCLVFFGYTWFLAKKINPLTLRWIFIITLFSSHFLVEFFSLSRGYGMSLACLLAFLVHFINFVENKKPTQASVAFLWLIMATAANLNLYFLLLCFAIFGLVFLVHHKSLHTFVFGAIAVYILPFFAVILAQLKSNNQLYIGKDLSLFNTVKTLAHELFFAPSTWISVYLIALFVVLFTTTLYLALKQNLNSGTWVFLLLLANVFGLFLAHTFADVNYPFQRTAIHLYLLFLVALFLIIPPKVNTNKWIVVLLAPLLLVPIKFIATASFTKISFNEWAEQQVPKRLYRKVAQQKNKLISGALLNYDTWMVENLMNPAEQIELQDKNVLWQNADFILDPKTDQSTLPNHFVKVDSTQNNLLVLYKNQNPKKLKTILDLENTKGFESKKLYLNLGEIALNNNIDFAKIITQMQLQCNANPFKVSLVMDVKNSADQSILWKESRLDYLELNHLNQKQFDLTKGIDQFPENAHKLLVYLYNPDRVDVNLLQFHLQILVPE